MMFNLCMSDLPIVSCYMQNQGFQKQPVTFWGLRDRNCGRIVSESLSFP